MAKKKTFRWRGMVTLFLLIVLIVDAASGIILYISPSGSIARWSGWTFWSMSKDQWESIHIVFSLMLLLILVGHLYFNWRMLTHFIWDKFRQVVTLKKELAGAFLIAMLVFAGTLWNVQPLRAITDFRETLKRSAPAGFASGFGRGSGHRTPRGEHQSKIPAQNNHAKDFINETYSHQQSYGRGGGRGGGLGRNAYTGQNESRNNPAAASQLKGRDYVRLGKLETHAGTLVRLNHDEWGLRIDGRVFEMHMGPSEYRNSKGFILKEGETATVSGYVYQNNLSVTTMKTSGQRITLRSENGQPVWAGSGFSRGGGRGRGSAMNGTRYYSREQI